MLSEKRNAEVFHTKARTPVLKTSGSVIPRRLYFRGRTHLYRRLVPRLGHGQAIGAITHRLCRLIWKILHERVRYEERGPAVSVEAKKVRARKMIRELRGLGNRVALVAFSSMV